MCASSSLHQAGVDVNADYCGAFCMFLILASEGSPRLDRFRVLEQNGNCSERGAPAPQLWNIIPLAEREIDASEMDASPQLGRGICFLNRTWSGFLDSWQAKVAAIQDRAASSLGAALLLRFVVAIER